MNIKDFYKTWLPRGSDWYYSLLSVSDAQRQAIAGLLAYSQTLNHAAERYTESQMAEVKLAWWQAEIERVYQHQAQHPLGQLLQSAVITFSLSKTTLLAIQEAAVVSLQTQRFTTLAELAQHYQHTGGILQGLIAQVLNHAPVDEATQRYAHTLGIGLETIRHMIDAPYAFARQHLYFPETLFTEHAIEVSTLLDKPATYAALPTLFKIQANYARDCCQQALALLPKAQYAIQKPSRIYTALCLKQLALIEQDGFQVFRHRLELSPLRKWYIAVPGCLLNRLPLEFKP